MMSYEHSNATALSGFAPFDQVRPGVLRELAPHVDRLDVRAGSVLAREGERAREFILVLSGEVAAYARDAEVGHRGPGAQIGGLALAGHTAHEHTWQAESDLEVLVVNGPAYRWVAHQILHDTAA